MRLACVARRGPRCGVRSVGHEARTGSPRIRMAVSMRQASSANRCTAADHPSGGAGHSRAEGRSRGWRRSRCSCSASRWRRGVRPLPRNGASGRIWAEDGAALLEACYADCERVTPVLDNLNTHTPGALYGVFRPLCAGENGSSSAKPQSTADGPMLRTWHAALCRGRASGSAGTAISTLSSARSVLGQRM